MNHSNLSRSRKIYSFKLKIITLHFYSYFLGLEKNVTLNVKLKFTFFMKIHFFKIFLKLDLKLNKLIKSLIINIFFKKSIAFFGRLIG